MSKDKKRMDVGRTKQNKSLTLTTRSSLVAQVGGISEQ